MTPDPVASNEGDFNVSQVWLDALSRGACDEDAFLRAVQMLTRRSPEAAWDSLALLDQYYRRGKISADVFKRVKSRLGNQLLGPALDVELSVPLRRHEPAPAAVVVPVPSPPHPTPTPVPPTAATPASPAVATPLPLAAATPRLSPAPRVRDETTSAPMREASIPVGWTVPIGTESPSIPVLNPARRRTNPVREGTPREVTPREVTVGDVLRGRYVIQNVLGLGGTGTVFEAIDRYRLDLPESGQRVAVKVLHSDAAGESGVLTDLRREFQLLQSLSHPNIVRAHEYDRDGDTAFFTMEYLNGLSLESVLSAHREVVLDRAHGLIIIRDVAAALEHAHSRGVVHGDLNPGNIFITNDGEIRVLDFGAAHTPGELPSMTESGRDTTAYATPRYASCQLLDGERADVRDDTYSLACVMYVILAGKHPFGELNAAEARAKRLKPARPAGLTGKQWYALRAALSFNRQRRPANIAGWLEPFDLPKPEARLPLLASLLMSPPRPSRRGLAAGLIVVMILALAAGGWWANGHLASVSQVTAEADADLKDAVAGAESAVTRLWAPTGDADSHARVAKGAPPQADVSGALADRAPVTAPSLGPAPSAPSAASPRGALPQPALPQPASPQAASPQGAQPQTAPPPASPSRSLAMNRTMSAPAGSPSPAAAAARPAAPRTVEPAMAPPAAAGAAAQASHARIELTADTVEVPLSDPAAHILVKRTGNLRAPVGFTWWTESGTAKPGQDFMNVKAHEEHFEDGKGVANLFVPVVSDPTRKEPRSFYIVIDEPSDGASLGKRTLTMVTILSSE